MSDDIGRKINVILRIINESKGPIGSAEIAAKLKDLGIDMSERTVRYHLKILNDRGLVKVFWKEGRVITSKGLEELSDSFVLEKVGFMSSKIDSMSYKMDFDLYEKKGKVILNVSFLRSSDFKKALKLMRPVFKEKLSTGDKAAIAEPGEMLGGIVVPEGKIGFGTPCSVNLNGILLKHSIPMESKFGGLLQIEDERPLRFVEIIDYAGSTLDPHEVFLKSRMTSVGRAVLGSGKVLAGMREIPADSIHEAEAIIRKIESAGVGRALVIGKPGQTILGTPVGIQRAGIVVPGGLNPIAAVEEGGILTENKALATMIDYGQLIGFWDL